MSLYFLAFLLGAIAVLSFAPFYLWWVGILVLMAMLLLVRNKNCGFMAGFAYGVGNFLFGITWLFHSIYTYGSASLPISIVAIAILIAILSIFPALAFWIYASTEQKLTHSSTRVIAFTAAWVLCEWLRSWLLTGFPWLLQGHAIIDSPFTGVIPVLGTFGASAFVAAVASILAEMVRVSLAQRMRLTTVLFFLGIGLFAIQHIDWTERISMQPFRVSLIQANIPSKLKWDESRRQQVYDTYLRLTDQHWDSDLIIWPESAIPTYYRVVENGLIAKLSKLAADRDTEILSGIFTYEDGSESIHNSLITIGGKTQIYNKKHLVPFGEFWPFRVISGFLRNAIDIPMSDIKPGNSDSILVMQDVPIGVSICYEAAFGEEIVQALPRAQLLVNVSDDDWFGDTLAPKQHLQIVRSRAAETGRFMLRATNIGISAVIDPKGNVISNSSSQFGENVIRGNVYRMTGSTPFVWWGNWAIISVSTFSLLIILMSLFYTEFKSKIKLNNLIKRKV